MLSAEIAAISLAFMQDLPRPAGTTPARQHGTAWHTATICIVVHQVLYRAQGQQNHAAGTLQKLHTRLEKRAASRRAHAALATRWRPAQEAAASALTNRRFIVFSKTQRCSFHAPLPKPEESRRRPTPALRPRRISARYTHYTHPWQAHSTSGRRQLQLDIHTL